MEKLRSQRRFDNKIHAKKRQKIADLNTGEIHPLGLLYKDLHHTIKKWFYDERKRRITNRLNKPENLINAY